MKFVAELSCNHLGSLDRALETIYAASVFGATHVKFQTFNPDQMVVSDKVLESGPWKGRGLKSLYDEVCTPREWHQQLFNFSKECGVIPFSSPFHPDDVGFLETLDCPIYKIASFELTYLDLIKAVALTGKPLILSAGMATMPEIDAACRCIKYVNPSSDVTLLKCTSAYPSTAADANLKVIRDMGKRFSCTTGVSDHSLTNIIPVVAVAMGAEVIEKHFTLSRSDGGPDSAFSLEPHEFQAMVDQCLEAREAVGMVRYGPSEAEESSLQIRRSLWFARDIEEGAVMQESDVVVARPADGLPPDTKISGLKLTKAVNRGEPVTWEVLS